MDENFCLACGMPLTEPSEIGGHNEHGDICTYCVDATGQLKSGQEIFQGGVEFFKNSLPNINQDLAERVVRRNMQSLPYWQAHPLAELEGPVATDEEFMSIIEALTPADPTAEQ